MTFLRFASLSLSLLAVSKMWSQTAVESGNRNQILHLGNMSEPNDLDPHISDSNVTFNICMALYEGLTSFHPKTNEPVPGVAERWEVADDNITWTFHLRKDARWSNGDPVTAHDFVTSFQRILSPRFGAYYAHLLFPLKNASEYNSGKIDDPAQVGARATDDHTLVLTLDHPVSYLPAVVSHASWYPVHRASIEKLGRIDQRGLPWTRPETIVTNGAFKLAEWRPHQFIRCVKSDQYWDRDHIKLKEVVFHPIESEDAEERAFRSGQIHVTTRVPTSKLAGYRKDRSDVLHEDPAHIIYFYSFNTARPPLDDARVRRALSMAIERDIITKFVTRGNQPPAGHFTPPDVGGFTSRTSTLTDIPKAKQLLAEAGYPNGRGFPRVEILYNTSEGHRAIAEAIQQMWKKNLGISVGLYNQEGKVWSDSLRQKNFMIARNGWVGDYIEPSSFLDLFASDNGNNTTNWSTPEYDALLVEARNTVDQKKRFEIYQRCEDILQAEMPVAPIYFYVRASLRLPSVKGWYGTPLDYHPLKGVYLEP